MVERLVGCFRGGQSLLRLSKKPFRTRRYLHHAFWSHGAGNIELPSWWKFLLQKHEPGVLDPNEEGRSISRGVAAGLHELFLGLLYPVQTHALIRRLNRATKSHRQAAQLARKGSREYTSIAEDLLAGKARTPHRVQNGERGQNGDVTFQEQSDAYHQRAEDLMSNMDNSDKYDQLWKLQQDAFEASNPLEVGILQEIFFLLSASKRKIDIERSLALFETFKVKSPVLSSRAVKAALHLKDINTAVEIHSKAATLDPSPTKIGTPDILHYAVLHGQWKLAIEIWYRLWRSKILYQTIQRDLWNKVDGIPLQELLLQTENAANFALHTAKSAESSVEGGPSDTAVTAAGEFALAMAERAFEIRGVPFREDQYIRLVDKIVALSDSGTKIRLQALGQLLSLKDRERFPRGLARREKAFFLAAVRLYQKLRQDPTFVPPEALLMELLTGLRMMKSCFGMLMILEDWKKFVPTKLPASLYVNMAKVIGGSGQVDAVNQLLISFIDDYPIKETSETTRTKMMNLSLWVHFKRADTTSILEKFDEYQAEYNFIPDTVSYNLIIMTFARVGDVDGAMDWFKSLQDSGLAISPLTYNSIMSMYAKRGDLDAVQEIWGEVEQSDIKPIISMIDALVVANVQDERFQEAEDLVEKAVNMDLEGSRTHMWNVLLNAYAIRGDLKKVSEVHARMHNFGVAEDSKTYAALLLSFCSTGNASSTMRIFKEVMPRLRIPRTALHYAIVMGGSLKVHDYVSVFRLYRNMLKKNLVPDTSIHNVLLRAAVETDEQERQARNATETEFVRAHEVLDTVLKSLNPAELAHGGIPMLSGATPIDQAQIASHYAYMIQLHGLKASFAKVNELYDEYIATAKQAGKENLVDDPPALMLCALLTAHAAAGNDEEVDRCWYLALEKYEKIAKRSNANLAEPGWVLHSRRFIINPILRQYLKHLDNRKCFNEMINVVKELRQAGYELHSPMWNEYVSYLARSDTPKHCYIAFEICENELMQGWPGWQHLATSNAATTKGSWAHMKLVLRRENRAGTTRPYKRMIRYETLVILAGAYSYARSGFRVSANNVSRDLLKKLAPVTAGAVAGIPRISDKEQARYLPQDRY